MAPPFRIQELTWFHWISSAYLILLWTWNTSRKSVLWVLWARFSTNLPYYIAGLFRVDGTLITTFKIRFTSETAVSSYWVWGFAFWFWLSDKCLIELFEVQRLFLNVIVCAWYQHLSLVIQWHDSDPSQVKTRQTLIQDSSRHIFKNNQAICLCMLISSTLKNYKVLACLVFQFFDVIVILF